MLGYEIRDNLMILICKCICIRAWIGVQLRIYNIFLKYYLIKLPKLMESFKNKIWPLQPNTELNNNAIMIKNTFSDRNRTYELVIIFRYNKINSMAMHMSW